MDRVRAEAEEATLVSAARQDPDAFDALYRRYVDRIYGYCYSQVGNRGDAEDLTAQVFLEALTALDRYQEQHCFAAWLFGIARNLCASYHRKRYAHPEVALKPESETCLVGVITSAAATGPEWRLIRQNLLDCIRTTLASISEDRKEALHLRFWGGLNSREIASIMGRGVGAVKMLIWRGINDLRGRCLDEV